LVCVCVCNSFVLGLAADAARARLS